METQDDRQYKVVVNHEEQYSIWFADRELPSGWREAGKEGTRAECLSHINEVWTDMRPLSLRQKMAELAQQPPQPEPPPPPSEPSLVERLSQGEHPVELVLRGERSGAELSRRLEAGYVHLKFTTTRGGTELGVRLDEARCKLDAADLLRGSGKIVLVGTLRLDLVPVECVATIDVATLTGTGALKTVAAG
jgi:uncharacterized protein YbdZ (MbtH family)